MRTGSSPARNAQCLRVRCLSVIIPWSVLALIPQLLRLIGASASCGIGHGDGCATGTASAEWTYCM